jgi:divalent metal cation (Fe/Co/Zn/Cd) transporter
MTASVTSPMRSTFVNLGRRLRSAATVACALPHDHSYGHEKAEYFASGVEGALILFAAGSIIYAAVMRFLEPVPLVHLGPGMLIALAAAAANYATARVMLNVAHEYDSIISKPTPNTS